MNNMISYEEFKNSMKKVSEHRVHKVTNSWHTYDAYKYIRKNKWFNIGRPLTEKEFYTIIRSVNKYLGDALIEGNEIVLPCRMGTLELRKYEGKVTLNKDTSEIKTNYSIDWDNTLKLWYEDEEAYKNKTLLKIKEKEIFKIYYNRVNANYNNKTYYSFKPNRELKSRLKKRIREGKVDAFSF